MKQREGYAHAQLETIHPILDDNGRIARLLITFLQSVATVSRDAVTTTREIIILHSRTLPPLC